MFNSRKKRAVMFEKEYSVTGDSVELYTWRRAVTFANEKYLTVIIFAKV